MGPHSGARPHAPIEGQEGLLGSGRVSPVVASQATVDAATVISTSHANSRGSVLRRPKPSCRTSETTNEAAIAETSLQALMRHQNHRRM
jgi:hypothetical protein